MGTMPQSPGLIAERQSSPAGAACKTFMPRETKMAAPVRCNALFGPATSAFSATAAKVDPHFMGPGRVLAFAAQHGPRTARDEVRTAVAVPVRHANAGGPHLLVVGDKQLWRAELWRPLRADVAAPIHPEPARTIDTLLADAQDQGRQALPLPLRPAP